VREWLDLYGGSAHIQQRKAVASANAAYQQARTTLEKRRQSERQRLQQLDLLTYQIQELRAANLSAPDEFEQLELERQRLGHVELQQLSTKSTRRFTKTIATPQQGIYWDKLSQP